jgi:hypothetical protein
MTQSRPEQKLISFTDNDAELQKISDDMKKGWAIVSLVKNGNYYVGIMEYNNNAEQKDSVFIPPRKKIKISR